MRYWLSMIFVGAIGALLISVQPQQAAPKKDKEPMKGPMFPPVNPALARLDLTATGLDGPGFSIAYCNNMVVASCEKGTIQAFKKDTLPAFKAGTGKPDVLKGHDGPVRGVAWTSGPILASAGADKKVNFWKMPEGKVVQSGSV